MLAKFICFCVCMIVAPGLFIFIWYAMLQNNWWLIAAGFGGIALLHLLYPLSKVDKVLSDD